MASPRDAQVLLTREILTLRVGENKRHLTPFYLLALLSSREVQRQIDHLVFIDTTLPNIGERWRELRRHPKQVGSARGHRAPAAADWRLGDVAPRPSAKAASRRVGEW